MNTNIVGNPDIFAVEYTITIDVIHPNASKKTLLGICKLWLNGKWLGDIGIDIYLNSFCHELQGIVNRFNDYKLIDTIPLLPNVSSEFAKLWENDDSLSRNSFLDIEGFDRFYKLCFIGEKSLTFYWCLDPDVTNSSEEFPEYADYPKEVLTAEIPISVVKEVADRFEERVIEIMEK
jgi:hypothetical protein